MLNPLQPLTKRALREASVGSSKNRLRTREQVVRAIISKRGTADVIQAAINPTFGRPLRCPGIWETKPSPEPG